MFTPQNKDGEPSVSAETFIGPSVKLEGNFSGDGDVVIEGILVGHLSTLGDVRVGQNAVIEAEIKAQSATIAGKIKGNVITTNSLKIMSSASIHGDIKTMSLTIEDGASINGKINMSKDKIAKEISSTETKEKEKNKGDK